MRGSNALPASWPCCRVASKASEQQRSHIWQVARATICRTGSPGIGEASLGHLRIRMRSPQFGLRQHCRGGDACVQARACAHATCARTQLHNGPGRTRTQEVMKCFHASCGVRTHAQLPAVDLKSTPLTSQANWPYLAARLRQIASVCAANCQQRQCPCKYARFL